MTGHEQWFAPGGGKEAITGFISPRGAKAISAVLSYQAAQGVGGNLAEIGTYFGKTFIGLVMAANAGETILGLDLYPETMQQQLSQSLHRRLGTDLVIYPRLAKVNSNALSHQAWRELLQNGPTRFVHVDGDHTYTAVVNDIRLAASFLCDHAVVVIDDFLHDWYPDVTEGVLDALRHTPNLRPVAVIPRSGGLKEGGTKLLCATPQFAGTYGGLMKATFPDLGPRSVTLAGHPALSFITND